MELKGKLEVLKLNIPKNNLKSIIDIQKYILNVEVDSKIQDFKSRYFRFI